MSDLTVSPLAAPVAPSASASARMRETATSFEASFLSQMLKPMFEGLSTDGMFGGGQGEETWRSFMIDAIAKQTVSAGGVGLADQVVAQMIRMQEEQAAA
jgi:peptidoglycan hydrolase FlgJ